MNLHDVTMALHAAHNRSMAAAHDYKHRGGYSMTKQSLILAEVSAALDAYALALKSYRRYLLDSMLEHESPSEHNRYKGSY